ncbi:unnamed protein product [Mytilus coruscus]|uniref:Uncharacterized protein n=1 Tax=Mytilus coruscus TaxID=42192 RepID=A0A6J8AJW0_MYTCO|nr:unnamed protein product [Mytilus coruscus]
MKEKGIQNRSESCMMNKIPRIIVVDEDDGHFFNQEHERPSTSSHVLNKSPLSQKPILNQRRFSASPISPRRRQSVSPSPAQQYRRQSVSPSPAQQCRRQSFSPSPGQPSRRQSVSPSPAQQCRRQSVSPSQALQRRRQSVSPSPALQSRRHSVSPPKEHIQRDSKSQKSTFSKYSNVDSVLFVELSVQSTSTDRKRLTGPNYMGRSNYIRFGFGRSIHINRQHSRTISPFSFSFYM